MQLVSNATDAKRKEHTLANSQALNKLARNNEKRYNGWSYKQ
jgi:hypothetical protein